MGCYLVIHLFYSNILLLTNKFNIADQSITLDNYDNWLENLNGSFPGEVSSLDLKHCDMNTFLEQVFFTSNTVAVKDFYYGLFICLSLAILITVQ